MKTKSRSLSMTTVVAAVVAATVVTSYGAAKTIGVDTTSWSFEGHTNGQDIGIISADSWIGEPDSFVAVATNAPNSSAGFPMATTHNFIAELTGGGDVTNEVSGGAGQTVWVDHLVLPRRWDDVAPPKNIPEDAQMAYYVNTNDHVVVYHHAIGPDGANLNTNIWSEINSVTIDSDDWIRVSVGLMYFDLDYTFRYFQMKINGNLVTNINAMVNPEGYIYDGGGSFFGMAYDNVTVPSQMNAISLKGTGKFDDFVVTTNELSFEYTYTIASTIAAGAAMGGSIDPPWAHVAEGSNQTFTVTAATDWTIAEVVIVENGATTTTNPPGPSFSWTFNNVTNNGSISATFAADMTTNGVPNWWLRSFGLTNFEADASFDDGDEFTPRQEYVASTDPTLGASGFRVTRTWQANGTNYLEWKSAGVDPALPPYGVLSATSVTGEFAQVGSVERAPTNTWSGPTPPVETFYRISASDTP